MAAGGADLLQAVELGKQPDPRSHGSPATHPAAFPAIDSRDHLLAMFRGGRERIACVFDATRHLLGTSPCHQPLWDDATRPPATALDVAARIALVSLHLQLGLFGDAMRRGGWTAANLLSLRQIEEDPVHACMLAARALGLNITTPT